MPTCMNRVHSNYSWRSRPVPESSVCNRPSASFVDSRPAAHIAKLDRTGTPLSTEAAAAEAAETNKAETYTYMDEEYLRVLQTYMRWNRDNGIIELMPIAVVYQGDSDIF